MQARRGLVQHINHAEKVRAQLRGQPQALQLTGRQRGRAAVESQIPETQLGQGGHAVEYVLRQALRRQHFFR